MNPKAFSTTRCGKSFAFETEELTVEDFFGKIEIKE
jgi:hypothetical protein